MIFKQISLIYYMKYEYSWYLMLKNILKYDIKYTKKESDGKMAKRKIDKSKIATRIIAAIMAILMVLGICFTLIYYLIRMF